MNCVRELDHEELVRVQNHDHVFLHTRDESQRPLARVLCARRALLYKRLADMVGLDCRVVKGRNYADGDDDAKVVVVLDGTEHYLGARALRSDVCVQVRHGGTVGGGGGRGWGRHK